MMAKVDPYLRPLFDALHDMLDPERVAQHLERGVIEIAPAGLHARTHAQRLVRHPRRGPEHEPRADEDVPHAAGLRLQDGRDRRHHPDRPPAATARPASSRSGDILEEHRRHRLRPLRRRGRRAPQARPAHRRGLRRARRASRPRSSGPRAASARRAGADRGRRHRAGPGARAPVAEEVERLCTLALASAGIEDGHLAVELVDAERIRELNREHRGRDARDRRALVPGRRGRRPPRARASWATS